MTITLLAGASIFALASFVFGLIGFGMGLVSLSLLPFIMTPATAVPIITCFGAAFALLMTVQLRREVVVSRLGDLIVGTLLGMPLGVWGLANLPPGLLKRLIGVILIAIVVIEWRQLYPQQLAGRHWGVVAGIAAGVLGGAVGTPGPPVILYVMTQGWSPRATKGTLQAFFLVNRAIIVAGHWWAGLITPDVVRLIGIYTLPSVLGVTLGIHLFNRIDQERFRRLIFALLFVLGLLMSVRG
jgi:uncharacterized membrane protein YfcA